jgi:ArsR family transcriptional regulator
VKAVLDAASHSADATIQGDYKRLRELEAERSGGTSESAADELERYYSPGRSWQSLALGIAGLLDLGDVLDVGAGDGAAAASIAPHCRSLTCVDLNERMVELARKRLEHLPHVRVERADATALPFADASFDSLLLFHTLTYADEPARVLRECARVLRPEGRLVLLCLDEHQQHEVTARYGERHPGFSPRKVRTLLTRAGLSVSTCGVACREAKKPHLQVVLATANKRRSSDPK